MVRRCAQKRYMAASFLICLERGFNTVTYCIPRYEWRCTSLCGMDHLKAHPCYRSRSEHQFEPNSKASAKLRSSVQDRTICAFCTAVHVAKVSAWSRIFDVRSARSESPVYDPVNPPRHVIHCLAFSLPAIDQRECGCSPSSSCRSRSSPRTMEA